MNLSRFAMDHPHVMAALCMVVIALGGFAFFKTPTDLFPDTVPPQVAVVTVKPGATARDMADQVTQVLEKELGTLSGVRRVTSTSRDEVSAINVEFFYHKAVGEAVVDVQNAVARVQGALPADIQPPRLFRITDANRPLMTLALSPKPESLKTLADIRLLAENDLRDRLLSVEGIGDVQVFGGRQPEVAVRVDREALAAHGLTLESVMAAISGQNVSAPAGTIFAGSREYLVNVAGEFTSIRALGDLSLVSGAGRLVYLRDVAQIALQTADARSLYHGNGRAAVAVNLLRPEKGVTVTAIERLKAALPGIEQTYPDIRFDITDDQQPLIDLNVNGMRSSLVQAVVLTVMVIFFFLADLRAAATVSVAIPLSFLAALVVLWVSPYTLNMVTLSGLIIAVGMVVDASVVVLENIFRTRTETPGGSPRQSALEGARQVALPVTAGMLTTVVVLVPVMGVGGYTGRVMKPLNTMIISTLVASLLVSLTVIPIIAGRLPGKKAGTGRGWVERLAFPVQVGMEKITGVYVALVRMALSHKWLFLMAALVFWIFTMRVVRPLVGGEQMPPMDTGIAIVEFDTDASASPAEVEEVLGRVEKRVMASPEVETVSAMAGSEPQAVSFGGGGATVQSVRMTVRLVPRTERDATIWQVEERWREGLRQTAGVRTFRVSEYGATPVATTKAPFNVVISGPDTRVLERLADEALARLKGTPGLVDLRRSWYRDKEELSVSVFPEEARLQGITPARVAADLRAAVQGLPASRLRLEGYLDIPIRVRYRSDQIREPEDLASVDIPTRTGTVKLGSIAGVRAERQPPFITREALENTVDLTAGNRVMTISQVTALARERLEGLPLPQGYTLAMAGSLRDMQETQGELGRALVLGLVLLFVLLFAMFRSFIHPVTIMLSIPLAVAGAMWGLLAFDKPICMPALMGIILLGGTIVNNAILMLDFIIEARKNGMDREAAIIDSVRLRIRPIFMTATSTVIGFFPLIFEMAVGLERMSPLGIAAASGLLVGTVVTMVYLPLIYVLLDMARERAAGWLRGAGKKTAALFLLGAMAAGAASSVRAAEPLPSPLTLSDAVALGLRLNPSLQQASAETRRREGLFHTTRSHRGVQVRLEGTTAWSVEPHNMVPGLSPENQGFSRHLYQAGAGADMLLSDFGATAARLQAAIARKEAARLVESRRSDELAFEISREFLALLTLKDIGSATEASLESLSALSSATDRLVERGRAARVDRMKIAVRLAETESRLAELEAERVTREHRLAALMGMEPPLPPLAEVTLLTVAAMVSAPEADPEASLFEKREDIAAQAAEAEAARLQVRAAGRERFPELRLFASGGYYGARDPEPAVQGKTADDWKGDAAVGLKVTLPLFDGGLRKGRLDQAVAEADAAAARLKERRLAAVGELAAARAEAQSARLREAAQKRAFSEARETLRIEKLKYASGRGAVADVLDAEAALLQAESRVKEAGRSLLIARLAEALAMGSL